MRFGLVDPRKILNSQVKGQDVLIGAAAGLAGIYGIKWLTKQPFLAGKLPSFLSKFYPLLGGAGAGLALYMGQKRSARGLGHLVGAAAIGAAVNVAAVALSSYGPLSEVVDVRLDGLITDDGFRALPAYHGIVDDTYSDLDQLSSLAAIEDDND